VNIIDPLAGRIVRIEQVTRDEKQFEGRTAFDGVIDNAGKRPLEILRAVSREPVRDVSQVTVAGMNQFKTQQPFSLTERCSIVTKRAAWLLPSAALFHP